ncbi:MAG: hydroxymethylbilane synthase [Actinomycetales bacterium]
MTVGAPRTVLRLGTRRSALATAQAQLVADALAPVAGIPVELVPITTSGDRTQSDVQPLEAIGGTGVFVTELRRALLASEVDLAVHSYKDLPTGAYDGLAIGAVPPRADPRDVLVARDGLTLGELPAGARVGTGSPRRAAQLRALDLGLSVEPIRGNVDTRLRAVSEGRYDAVVLARAGLHRLGRTDEATEVLDPIQVLPAPGQGALAVECRADDDELLTWLAALDDSDSNAAVRAERAVLAALEAGCSAPVGALAEVVDSGDGAELSLRAVVAAPDGSDTLRRSMSGPVEDPDGLGRRLAAVLLEDGAAELAPELLPRQSGESGQNAQAVDQSSHASVAPRTPEHERGSVHTNPPSTTTERVS